MPDIRYADPVEGVWRSYRTGRTFSFEDAFVLGETKPYGANTGMRTLTTSTSSGGTLYIDSGGTVESPRLFERVRFERRVVVRTAHVRFVDCEFVGQTTPGTSHTYLVDCGNANAADVRFDFCTFRPQTNSVYWADCVGGHSYSLWRCDLSGCVDCVAVNRATGATANVTIEGCYLHGMAFYAGAATGQSDLQTHNDCIQLHNLGAFESITIRGNTLDGRIDPTIGDYAPPVYSGSDLVSGYPWYGQGLWGLSSIMFSPPGSATLIEDFVVDRNWISGGAVGLNMAGFTGSGHSIKVTGNRWGRDFRLGEQYSIIKQSGFHFTGDSELTGNTYEDDGTPWDRGGGAGTWP